MSIQEVIEDCERRADRIEAEIPEFAKVLREAVEVMRSWED